MTNHAVEASGSPQTESESLSTFLTTTEQRTERNKNEQEKNKREQKRTEMNRSELDGRTTKNRKGRRKTRRFVFTFQPFIPYYFWRVLFFGLSKNVFKFALKIQL